MSVESTSSSSISSPASSPKILCFGEALYDCFPQGKKPGGAPLNVASTLSQLGGQVWIWTALGQDDDGKACRQLCSDLHINTEWITAHAHWPTGTVKVTFEEGEPHYEICSDVAWDEIPRPESYSDLDQMDAFYFGSLAARTSSNRMILSQAWQDSKWIFFDLNLRPPFVDWEWIEVALKASHVLKLNEDEWSQVSRQLSWSSYDPSLSQARPSPDQHHSTHEIISNIQSFMDAFELEYIILTRGARGTLLITPTQAIEGKAGIKTPGGDPVGAGDACAATVLLGLLQKRPLEQIVSKANQIGAYVASQEGGLGRFSTQLKSWKIESYEA